MTEPWSEITSDQARNDYSNISKEERRKVLRYLNKLRHGGKGLQGKIKKRQDIADVYVLDVGCVRVFFTTHAKSHTIGVLRIMK